MVIAATGGPGVLTMADVARPTRINAEVLVKIMAAGINPIDAKTRSGGGTAGEIPSYPAILGRDFSGVVIESPFEACAIRPGDEVFGMVSVPRVPGTYAEYVARAGDDHLDIDAVSLKAKSASAAQSKSSPPPAAGLSWEEQKKRRNRLGTMPARRDKLLAQIEAAEARKKAIADSYAQDGFFERTSPAEVQKLEAESLELGKQVETWLAEWEAIETEIAKITAG